MIETQIDPKTKLLDFMSSIQDNSIRSWTMSFMARAPQAFWDKPASSSGKYHKPDENGTDGQVIHTLRVCSIIEHLVRMDNIGELNRDILISSAILHDICKYGIEGQSEHTLSEHPQLVKSLWGKNLLILPKCPHDRKIIDTILQHSGRWGGLPHPTPTHSGKLLHIADFIASRHNINVDLNKELEF
jgi:HD superfamily phosphohydrolase YqeK